MSVDVAEGPFRLPVAIGSHRYQAEFTEDTAISTTPALRQAVDQGSEPGENSLNTEGLWARTQRRFELGQGQDYYDDEESDRRRFRDAQGLDVFSIDGELSMLKDAKVVFPLSSDGGTYDRAKILSRTSQYWWYSSAGRVYYVVAGGVYDDRNHVNLVDYQQYLCNNLAHWVPVGSSATESIASSKYRMTATATPTTINSQSCAAIETPFYQWSIEVTPNEDYIVRLRVKANTTARDAFLRIEIVRHSGSTIQTVYSPLVNLPVGVTTDIDHQFNTGGSMSQGMHINVTLCVVNAAAAETFDLQNFYVVCEETGAANFGAPDRTMCQFAGDPSFLAEGAVMGMATDGDGLYVANASGVWYEPSFSLVWSGPYDFANFSPGNADAIAIANGRLVVANANKIQEIDSVGTRTDLFTHSNDHFNFDVIASAPNGVYCSGRYDSGEGEVYVFTVDDATGALDVVTYATSLPGGEAVEAMKFYGGLMVLGTSRGVRLAQISSGGSLIYGPLLTFGDPGEEDSVYALDAEGEFVRFGLPGVRRTVPTVNLLSDIETGIYNFPNVLPELISQPHVSVSLETSFVPETDDDDDAALETSINSAHAGGEVWRWSTSWPLIEGETYALGTKLYPTAPNVDVALVLDIYDEADVLLDSATLSMPASGHVLGTYTLYTTTFVVPTGGVTAKLRVTAGATGVPVLFELAHTFISTNAQITWPGRKTQVAKGSGMLSLQELTGSLVPAWTHDLLSLEDIRTYGLVSAVATVNAHRVFAVNQYALFVEQDDLVEEAHFDSGWMRFGTIEPKVLTAVGIRHKALRGEVDVCYVDETETLYELGTSDVAGSLSPANDFTVNARVGEAFRIFLRSRRSASTPSVGPVLRRWTAKALVAPERVDEFLLPLQLFGEVDGGPDDESPITLDPKAEWLFLKGLEAAGTVVNLKIGNDDYKVRVDRVRMQPRNWTDDKEFFEGICLVRMVTTEPIA